MTEHMLQLMLLGISWGVFGGIDAFIVTLSLGGLVFWVHEVALILAEVHDGDPKPKNETAGKLSPMDLAVPLPAMMPDASPWRNTAKVLFYDSTQPAAAARHCSSAESPRRGSETAFGETDAD